MTAVAPMADSLYRAWQQSRPAVIWAATPFELVRPTENRVLAVNGWLTQAEALPPVQANFTDLPPASILSLDPTARLARDIAAQGQPVCIVRGAEQVPRPGEHVLYPLAGELAARSALVLTREEIRDLRRDEVKRRWLLEPWLEVARAAGVVLLLGTDPLHRTFRAWWDELLQPALASLDVLAVGDAAAHWPDGITVITEDWTAMRGAVRRIGHLKEDAMEFTNGYALIVGVGGVDLQVTITDAQGLYDLLTDPARCAYPRSHVQLLTVAKASRKAVLDAFDSLAKQVAETPDATIVVYFSGHGWRVQASETTSYYLITHGYQLNDLPNTAINGSEFTAKLAALRVQKLVVFLDCCHAGGFERTKAPGATIEKAPTPFDVDKVLSAGGGRVILASSKAEEVSWTGTPYSVFTNALLEGLAGAGSTQQDGYARITDIFNHVTTAVPKRTKDLDPQQHPVMQTNNLDGNFALAYCAAGAKSPRPLDWMGPLPGDRATRRAVSPQQRERLRRDQKRLGDSFDTLSKRIAAFDVEIGRTLQAPEKQILEERRAELVADRDEVEHQIADIEDQLEPKPES